jgi:hypothetical protein
MHLRFPYLNTQNSRMDPVKQEQHSAQGPGELNKSQNQNSQRIEGSEAEESQKLQQGQRSLEGAEMQEPSGLHASISSLRLNIVVFGYVFALSQLEVPVYSFFAASGFHSFSPPSTAQSSRLRSSISQTASIAPVSQPGL